MPEPEPEPVPEPVPVPAPAAPRRRAAALEGWAVLLWVAAALAAISAGALLLAGPPELDYRRLIRATARLSITLFLVIFTASPLMRLAPSAYSRWALRNRRYLGVSLALSQAVHAVAIALLMVTLGGFRSDSWLATGGGMVGYLLLIAMTITSFDGPARALGRARWRVLHTAGICTLFVIFLVTYAGHLGHAPIAAVPVALLLGALALRVIAWTRTRRRRPA